MSIRDRIARRFRRPAAILHDELVGMTTEPDPRHDEFDKIEGGRIRGVSVDREPSPTGGRVIRVTDYEDAVTEEQMRQDLGLPAPAGQGLNLDQLEEAEAWYCERFQAPPSWIYERRAELLGAELEDPSLLRQPRPNPRLTQSALDAVLTQARSTAAAIDEVHGNFEDRLAAVDQRIADTAARIAEATNHTHVWDQPDADGRWNWKCACGETKCDLPRCIRGRHPVPPHHIRS